jgi:multisubunit Na+/H+ antiporter MnhG subunit
VFVPAVSTSTISLLGGSVILTGALLTVIGYSEHYKDEERGETTRTAGALITSLGAAVSFLASAVHLSGGNYKILLWTALIVASLTVVLLGAPRLAARRRGEENSKRGEGEQRAQAANKPISGGPVEP